MAANQQLMMSYGSNPWPGSPVVVHDFARGSALNASGLPCTTYGEAVASIRDLTGNGHTGTQATAGNRCFFLPAGTGYMFCNNQFNAPSDKTEIPRGGYLNTNGAFTVDACIAPDDWSPGTLMVLASKGQYGIVAGGFYAWEFWLSTAGNLVMGFWKNGASGAVSTSTANLSALANNSQLWVRTAYNPNTGSGNYSVEFYTSPDGVTWTQLGTTLTGVSHNTIDSGLDIVIGASGNSNVNTTRFSGRYYQFRYYIAGTLTVDWVAGDSNHLMTWGPLRTGLGGFVSYANQVYLIKEDSIFNDGNDAYGYSPTIAPGTSWVAAMKSQCDNASTYTMNCFEGAGNAVPHMIMFSNGSGGGDASFLTSADASLSAVTGVTAADQAINNVNSMGNFIADRTGSVITMQDNGFTIAPATTAPSGGNINQLFASNNVTRGVMTRAILYGSTKPSNADLKTYLGVWPGRNMLRWSQDLDEQESGNGWQYVNVAVSGKNTANPIDGKVNASLVTMTGALASHYVYRTTPVKAGNMVAACYIKRAASLPTRYVSVSVGDGVTNIGIVVDTTTWLASFVGAGVTYGIDPVVSAYSSGWYRVWVSGPNVTGASGNFACSLTTAAGIALAVNAPGEGVYVWGCQLHPGTTPDPYRPKGRNGTPYRSGC